MQWKSRKGMHGMPRSYVSRHSCPFTCVQGMQPERLVQCGLAGRAAETHQVRTQPLNQTITLCLCCSTGGEISGVLGQAALDFIHSRSFSEQCLYQDYVQEHLKLCYKWITNIIIYIISNFHQTIYTQRAPTYVYKAIINTANKHALIS